MRSTSCGSTPPRARITRGNGFRSISHKRGDHFPSSELVHSKLSEHGLQRRQTDRQREREREGETRRGRRSAERQRRRCGARGRAGLRYKQGNRKGPHSEGLVCTISLGAVVLFLSLKDRGRQTQPVAAGGEGRARLGGATLRRHARTARLQLGELRDALPAQG